MNVSNYLDDFLNMALSQGDCNIMLQTFHQLCDRLRVPIAKGKTVWATLKTSFPGILLIGDLFLLALPNEKVNRAIYLLRCCLDKKKATVKEIQSLTGLLNFLNRAIVPGRAFTRCMYAQVSGSVERLHNHHHVSLSAEFRGDCRVWLKFLVDNQAGAFVLCRPFCDLDQVISAQDLHFFMDSSANADLGFGGIFGEKEWFFGQWEPGYIHKFKPSIAYLELYAVCTGLYIWSPHLANKRILIHCDNQAVVSMVNNTTSGCKRCMHLIRLLVLRGLKYNFRVFAVYIQTDKNDQADSLSRLQFSRFVVLSKGKCNKFPEMLPVELWPASKLWNQLHIEY